AQCSRVSLVRLCAPGPDAERPDERCRNNPGLVAQLLGHYGHPEGLCAGLHDHSALWPIRQVPPQVPGLPASLVDDLAVAASHADLRFPCAQIDRNMLHGWLPSLAAEMTALTLSDGNPSARRDRSQPLHRVCA